MNKTCGTCAYICRSDGKPYFCITRDLYYLVEEKDRACEDYVEDAKHEQNNKQHN